MKIFKIAFSNDAPNVKDTMWAKPVAGGFSLYLPDGGTWKPLQVVDDNETSTVMDDVAETVGEIKKDLVGSTKDKKSANTINGAKAYADDAADTAQTNAVNTVTGTAEDTAEDMTLYGLKAYIDAQVTG